MKNKMLSNPGLKIASLIIAFFIWIVIVNVNDPLITRTIYNVPVQIVNSAYIESLGKSYKLQDGFESITVKIKGNRSTVENLTADSIEARADLTEIVSLTSNPITVPVRVSVTGGVALSEVSSAPDTVQISLEELVSADFVITGTTKNTKPSGDYEVARLSPENEKVTITGPSSIIDIIDKVEAPVDVSDISEDTVCTASLVIYDKNGSQLTDTQLSYLHFNVDEKDVKVAVTLHRIISNVQVVAEDYSGSPASGYQITEMTVVPNTISVVGSEESLEAFEQSGGKVVIDSSLIDVSGRSTSFDIRIDNISTLLPEGLSLAASSSGSCVISVEVLPYNSKSVKVPSSQIQKKNLSGDLGAVFSLAEFDVMVEGSDSVLKNLEAEDISLSADFTGMEEGTYNVTLSVTLPSGCSLLYPVTAEVTLQTIKNAASQPAITSNSTVS